MSKRWKKVMALGLAAVLCMLPACGKANTSGTAGTEVGGSAAAGENQAPEVMREFPKTVPTGTKASIFPSMRTW